jgi:UDP-N-acetyl-D-glucosamine dehydrogenase
MKVLVCGLGYVGTSLAKAAHGAGHEVIGFDSDSLRIEKIRAHLSFEVRADFPPILNPDIAIICVPTPLDNNRQPDLSHLRDICNQLKGNLKKPTLIINESTSYPGTLRNLLAPTIGSEHFFVVAPERIDPGNEKWNIKNTPRLIAGLSQEATDMALKFYQSFCENVISVSSPEVAEAAKLFENTFRQVNIALVNEFAQIAEALGISAHETLEAAATKPYGFMPFFPGVGVGGHCIPVDPSYLSHAAKNLGVEATFINLANEVNDSMPRYIAKRIKKLLGENLLNKRIQIAGVAYKADVSDIRESPALALMANLREMGAIVSWHDELVGSYKDESSSKLEAVDLGIIATAHSEVDYEVWVSSQTLVLDLSATSNTGWPKFL